MTPGTPPCSATSCSTRTRSRATDFDPSDAVEFWDLVNRQDWSICEQVQDGMGSRMFTAGYLAPMEQPSADVSRYVTRRLGAWRPPEPR